MRWGLLGALCGLWALTWPLSAWAAPSPRAIYDAAKAAGTEAAYEDATEALARLIPEGEALEEAERRLGGRAAYTLGELIEARGQIGALRWYQRALALDPGGRFAGRARRRIEILSARPEEGGAALARLQQIKRQAVAAGPEATRRAVEALAAEAPASVAPILAMWLARDDLEVQGRPEAALDAALRLAESAEGVAAYQAFDLALRAVAQGDLVGRRGPELVAALEAYDRRHPEDTAVETLRHDAIDLVWRRRALWAAWGALGILALGWLWRRGWRGLAPAVLRRWRPWRGGAFLGYVFAAAAVIAELWSPGYLWPFLCCGLAVIAVHLLVGSARHAGPLSGLGRAAWALIGAGATLAACFLALHAFGVQALMGM